LHLLIAGIAFILYVIYKYKSGSGTGRKKDLDNTDDAYGGYGTIGGEDEGDSGDMDF